MANKSDLINAIALKTGKSKKDCGEILDAATDAIAEYLKQDESVLLVGFGTFSKVARAARQGINPQTLQSIEIPATFVPKFSPGKELKRRIVENSRQLSKTA
jgi:DNA-binding protein HU-beta